MVNQEKNERLEGRDVFLVPQIYLLTSREVPIVLYAKQRKLFALSVESKGKLSQMIFLSQPLLLTEFRWIMR